MSSLVASFFSDFLSQFRLDMASFLMLVMVTCAMKDKVSTSLHTSYVQQVPINKIDCHDNA